MKATDVRLAVLKVLHGQSPGYFIFPNAAAFVAAGLVDADDVADVLAGLLDEGQLERELVLIDSGGSDQDDAAATALGGYRLKREGGETVDETTEPTEPEPTAPEPEPDDDE